MMLFTLAFRESFAQKEEIKTVKIGNQVWMAKNLDVDTFINGDKLYYASSYEEWKEAELARIPAFHYLNFNKVLYEECGKYYNWYAINDIRQLSPQGFHIPSEKEWELLISGKQEEFNSSQSADYNMHPKTINSEHLKSVISIFNEKRCENGGAEYDNNLSLWSSNEFGSNQAVYVNFRFNTGSIDITHINKSEGKLVRCIKDSDLLRGTDIIEIQPKETVKQIKIGSQVWMRENLNTDRFRNGDKIKEATTNEEWINAGVKKEPAWSYLNNDIKNGKRFGKLYNWYAINDPRGLAPEGWSIPTDSSWDVLIETAGGVKNGSIQLKKPKYWTINNHIIDLLDFSALPGGMRYYNGNFNDVLINGFWWTKSEYHEGSAIVKMMLSSSDETKTYDYYKSGGFSVRCIKE